MHLCIPAGAFDDPDVIHVEDSVDPIRDLDIIHNELRLKVRPACWMAGLCSAALQCTSWAPAWHCKAHNTAAVHSTA